MRVTLILGWLVVLELIVLWLLERWRYLRWKLGRQLMTIGRLGVTLGRKLRRLHGTSFLLSRV